MTFEEWDEIRKNSLEMVEKTVHSLTQESQSSELAKLFGSTYTDSVTDEIREYTKTVTLSLIEEDLHQIAVALNKIAEGSVKEPEATSRKAKWIEHPHEAGLNWEYSRYECSECHVWADDDSDYCPNCGAKMYVEAGKVVDDLMKELAHEDE